MADITLCTGTGCLLRGSCWRYRAPPNEQQSRADFPGERNGAACSYYWPCGETALRMVDNVLRTADEEL